LNIILLLGGFVEREVSLLSGKEVKSSLSRLGHKVKTIDIAKYNLLHVNTENIDLIFNSLHGGIGENGVIQSVCEIKKIPYTSSNVLSSALAMNKVLSKKIFASDGINVPKGIVANIQDIILNDPLPRPYVVKPIDGGSSVGVEIITKDKDLNSIKFSDNQMLIESYIEGREVAVAVIDKKILGMIEITYTEDFYDYDAKYFSEKTKYFIPENLNINHKDMLKKFSMSAHKSLGCKGVTRSDFIIPYNNSDEPILLEINTLPGLTKHSLVPKIAKNAGINFDSLIEMIIKDALI
jgi:D-alanine-D-alanine ligase